MAEGQVLAAKENRGGFVSRLFGRYIIKNRIQFKFSFMVFFFMGVDAITLWFQSDYVIKHLIDKGIISDADAVESLHALSRINFLRSILALAIVFGLSLFFSHFVAGPIYRMERTFQQFASVDLSMIIRLRKNDELKDTAEMLNTAVSSLRRRYRQNQDHLHVQTEKLRKAADALKSAGKTEEAAEIEKIVFDLENNPSQFKI